MGRSRPAQSPDGGVEVDDPARFHDVFCADVPYADAAFMAISQRPVSATAFDDPATAAPGGRSRPGRCSAPPTTRSHPSPPYSYDRAASTVTEVVGASTS
jgi:hypothetical protein